MLRLVSPVLQTLAANAEEVRITLSLEQKFNGRELVMVGVVGRGCTETLIEAEDAEQPFAVVLTE